MARNGHDCLVTGLPFDQFGYGVMPEVVKPKPPQPGFPRKPPPCGTPAGHGFCRVGHCKPFPMGEHVPVRRKVLPKHFLGPLAVPGGDEGLLQDLRYHIL